MVANLLFKNVTVSGLPGAGSSTLAKSLAEKLDWNYFCGGDFMRMYAQKIGHFSTDKKIHHDSSAYDEDFDRKVDYQQRDMVSTSESNVVESWLSGFFAQGISGTLKVLVVCSQDAIRIDRIVNRDGISVEEAKKHIFEREQTNIKNWSKYYAKEWQEWVVNRGLASNDKPIYFWYPQLYDVVLDTFSLSKEQTLQNVLDKLGYQA
ncbi:AAA family ATPase [Candidatus Beckwithbacteria bacterium]|nr:AAA family ATPase [Candidatus Beckwithbacteria bacterium]